MLKWNLSLEECGNYKGDDILLQVNKEDPTATRKGQKMIVEEKRAVVYHGNLKQYVTATTKMLQSKGLLIEKPGLAPGKLEVLWSADKSDDFFLCSFQILNTQYAQSCDNTRVALIMKAPDTWENLNRAFKFSELGTYS